MDQISRAVLQMEKVTQRTAAGADRAPRPEDNEGHAGDLRALVHEMRAMVGGA